MCESLFAALECELLDRHRFRSHADARRAVSDFIDGWYNGQSYSRENASGEIVSPDKALRHARC